jgi:hypothetical protein
MSANAGRTGKRVSKELLSGCRPLVVLDFPSAYLDPSAFTALAGRGLGYPNH